MSKHLNVDIKNTNTELDSNYYNVENHNWDEIRKIIKNQGVDILSDAAFLDWLDENGIKHREEVQTFNDLPANDSLNTVRGVADDNKIYIKKENGWVPFQTIDISKINEVDGRLTSKIDEKEDRSISVIENFDGKGDGLHDNTEVFHTMFDRETVHIVLKAGTYKTGTLLIPMNKNVVIEGAGKDITEIYCTSRFIVSQNVAKANIPAIGLISEGDMEFRASSTTNIKRDDLVVFTTTQRMDGSSSVSRSHSAIVVSISGNLVKIDRPFPTDFNADDYNLNVKSYSVGKVSIKNLTISGEYDGMFSEIKNASGFNLSKATVINRHKKYQGETSSGVFDNTSTGGTMIGFINHDSVDAVFDDVDFKYLSYGVMPTRGSVNTRVRNSKAYSCRHICAPTGGAQDINVESCNAYNCWAGFDSHPTAYKTTHVNCNSYGDEITNYFRGMYDVVENCIFSAGLSMEAKGVKTKKVANNVRVTGFLRFQAENISISNLEATDMTTIIAQEFLSISDLTINKKDYNYVVELPTVNQSYIMSLTVAKNTTMNNVNIFGPKKGVLNGGGEKSSMNLRAFTFSTGEDTDILSLNNVIVDGFDTGMTMGIPRDMKRFIFNNVLFKNCVVGIDTSANFKENVDISKVYFDSCGTDITDPDRLR